MPTNTKENKMNLENIVFTPQQFFDAVDNAPKGSCIIWYEADDLGEEE